MRNHHGTAGNGRSLRKRFIAAVTSVALFTSLLAVIAPGQATAGIATFSMELIGGERTVSSGEYVQYRFSFSCSGLDSSCGATDIVDDLDSNLDFVDVTVAAGWTGSYDSGSHRVTISHTDFLDGAAAEATITARVKFGTPGGIDIPNSGTITYATPSGGASGVQDSATYTVSTAAPTPSWTVTKTKASPSGNPAPDGDVEYTVSICATTGLANVDLLSASLVDTIPVNTTITDPGGGTVDGGQVTWDLGDLLISSLYAGTNGTGQKCESRSLTLNFPAGSFPSGSQATNGVEGFGDTGSGVGSIGSDDYLVTIIDPVQDVSITKSGTSENIPGGRLSYTFRWNATGSNVNVENMAFQDSLPAELDLFDVRSGRWSPSTIKADVEYSTDGGTNWTTVATVDGDANTTWTVSGGDFPATTTDMRWVFFDDTSGSRVDEVPPEFNEGTRPRIRMDVPMDFVTPGTVQNCVDLTYDSGSADQDCTTASIIDPIPRLDVAKELITSGDISPGDEIQWEVRIRNTGYLDLTDPTIADLLPSQLEFVTWDAVTFDAANATTPNSTYPNIEVIDDYNGSGRQLLRWTWTDTPPAGSYAFGGAAAQANGVEINPNDRWVRIRFTTRVAAGTSDGAYFNEFAAFEVTTPECGDVNDTSTDVYDLDGDGNFAEGTCLEDAGWSVIPAAVVSSQAWVSANAGLEHVDPDNPTIFPNPICPDLDGATRYPCSARTAPGGTFTYHLLLENSGNIPLTDYIVYDILPFRGDTGITEVLSGVSRNSEWIPDLEGPIVAADAFTGSVPVTIEYSMSTNPCRPELSNSSDESGWQSSCVNDWTTSPADYTLVRAFRINAPFTSSDWGATEQLRYDVPMRAPFGAEYDSVAWNSMAHRVTNADTDSRLGASEPRMVGIMVPSESLAEVDRFDLALRKTIVAQSDFPIGAGTDVTYKIELFNQGNVDATNVVVTDYVPAGMTFTSADNAGWTGADGASTPTYTVASLTAGTSQAFEITLEVDSGTSGTVTNTAEISSADGGTDDDSTPDAVDADLVVDDEIDDDGTTDEDDHDIAAFTVGATTYRIGNLVWLDADADGHADVAEAGIENVVVELWADDATAGPSVGDTLTATTTTDSSGFYNFPGLAAGDYYVVLPDSTAIEGLTSAPIDVADPDDDTDNDDNGASVVAVSGAADGLASGVLTLAPGEPTDEVERFGSVTDADADGFDDANSNYSVDFGFVRLRVGNLVWYDDGVGDTDGDGTAASNEDGISGVTLQLYEDLDADGRIDAADPLVATTTTDANGNYGFVGVQGGTDYVIGVPADQTGQSAGVASFDLRDLDSSYGTATGDNNDHGDAATSFQSVSTTFSVAAGSAPTGETDGTTGSDAEAIADTLVLGAVDTNSDQTIDFGFAEDPTYSIGNLVFDDLDADGTADVGEPGFSGVNVELWKDDGDGVADDEDLQINTTTTDGDGAWQFVDLTAGDYYVVVPIGQSALADHQVSPNVVTDPDDDVDNDNDISGGVAVSGGPIGYTTGMITLGEGLDGSDEPTDEETRSGSGVDDDPGTTVRDDRTNLSVDLGFYRISLGNRVWYDADADGQFDSGEENGLSGVSVTLRDAGSDAVVSTDLTDINGHYLFTGLTQGGTYIVEIDAANFASGGALENLVSTTGSVLADDDIDADDSGIDPASDTDAVRSSVVTLAGDTEPTGEADDNDGVTSDASENLTVDFGFTGLSIGNRVWFDSNNDGDDDSETGIGGVTVNLRLDADDSLVKTTTTDIDGEYLFSGLDAGDYYVEIPASNWSAGGALVASRSVPDTVASDTDGDDDGIDPASDGDAVRSATVTLDHGTEPTGESPDNGVAVIPDDNENLTIDFGFHGIALGNTVFLDATTVNGSQDADEYGVGGVTVELHRSSDDALLDTTTTDRYGRYLFLGLDDGESYVVTVPSSEFVDGAVLEGFTSATANGEPAPNPDDDVDGDDNGIAGADVDSYAVTVSAGGEPTVDGDELPENADIGPIDDANTQFTLDFGFITTTPLGVGSLVWKDLDADGTVNSTNEEAAGVPNVTVELHRDDDGDGQPDRATPFATTTTDAGGYYLFTGMTAGDWVIELPSTNFESGAVLEGWHSTGGVQGVGDQNDDGIDPTTVAGDVFSGTITLAAGIMPIDEPDKPAGGLDWDGLGDANVDLTYDFGFSTLSIGNRVFYDEDADGTFDNGTDRGIPGVVVELWQDWDEDDTFELFQTTSTVAGGFYEFGGLANGTYQVVIPAVNFIKEDAHAPGSGRLDVLESSPGVTDADSDVDEVDDGIDPAQWGDAVMSGVIDMTAGAEPTAENPDPWGQLVDSNGNLTIDFGFRRQCIIGAMAWFDTTDNDVHDIDEFPAAGELATLVNDDTEEVIATNVADQYGWYLFEHLTPGVNYRVDFEDPNIDSQYPTCVLYC
ncbi:MAG: SdrD B-like domain-containing protein [Actinomycetota bacterium]